MQSFGVLYEKDHSLIDAIIGRMTEFNLTNDKLEADLLI